MSLISEKKQLFKDFNIPWNKAIETDYKAYKKANGAEAAEIHLDNVCQSYITNALDRYPEIVYETVKANHPEADAIYEDVLKKEIGRYAFSELVKANLIELCGAYRGRKLYAI